MTQVVGDLPVRVRAERLVAAGDAALGEFGGHLRAAPLRSRFNALRGLVVAVIAA